MNGSTNKLSRLATAIVLVASLASLAIPTALAGGQSRTILDRRSPDTRDAAIAAANSRNKLDPAIATALNAHGRAATLPDLRSPDTRDAAIRAHPDPGTALDPAIAAAIRAHQNPLTPADGRSPDTADAAFLAHGPVVTLTTPSGFAWPEFAIGAAAATAAILLLLGLRRGLPVLRERREILHPTARA